MLSLRQAAEESARKPSHCLPLIFLHNQPSVIEMCHFVASERMALLSCQSVPMQRLTVVFGNTFAVLVHPPQTKLRTVQILSKTVSGVSLNRSQTSTPHLRCRQLILYYSLAQILRARAPPRVMQPTNHVLPIPAACRRALPRQLPAALRVLGTAKTPGEAA